MSVTKACAGFSRAIRRLSTVRPPLHGRGRAMQDNQPSPPPPSSAWWGRVLNDIAHVLNSDEHAESRLDSALNWLRRVVPSNRSPFLVSDSSGPRLTVTPEAPAAEQAAISLAMTRLFGLLSGPGSPHTGTVPLEVSQTLPYGSHLAVPADRYRSTSACCSSRASSPTAIRRTI